MPVELKVPSLGESISEVQIGAWAKREGDAVEKDEHLVELESEKTTLEVGAPAAGVVTKILKRQGDTATIGEVIALVDDAAPRPAGKPAAKPAEATPQQFAGKDEPRVMPAAQAALARTGVAAGSVAATGPGGRMLKEDVLRAAEQRPVSGGVVEVASGGEREVEVKPMSPIRRTIAQRLVEAQSTAALLTTFNEVDMSGIMALRKKYQDAFTERYKIKLGFMSFFVKAAVDALRRFPAVNAQLRGNDIVYHNYCDVGIAVGGGKGLVVPVIRSAERLSFAEIEQTIAEFGAKAKDNKLKPEDLEGGTFTISNGGIYGSLLSTPIVNPPQSGILGMHTIQERPVVRDGQIVIRPMMYLALTYDHRLVDGREAVSFLVRIKDSIEDPTRMFVEV